MLAVYRGVKYDTNRNLVKETAEVKAVSKYREIDSSPLKWRSVNE